MLARPGVQSIDSGPTAFERDYPRVATALSHAGLDEQEVQIGLAAFAAVGVLSTLTARPLARRAANRAARSKKGRSKAKDRQREQRRSREVEEPKWDETHPLVEGVPDKNRTPEHRFLQQTVADDMRASGDYVRVGMGRPLSEFSGMKPSPDIKPDNIGLTPDGKIDMLEIKSPRQTKEELRDKLLKALKKLPPAMRGGIGVFDPGDARK